MKTKIKVGDRVAVYGFRHMFNGEPATVRGATDIYLNLETDNGLIFESVHPKQCRKLRSKAKKNSPPKHVFINAFFYSDSKTPYDIRVYKTKRDAVKDTENRGKPTDLIAVRYVSAKKQKKS